ncbi:unnamed protein product [marine sediment metagenome]|uniref:Winged helix-turn-helix domain-containing protein n=1 Tax=marine sediment metagenome TaxID=412755 RepID=X0WM24_9ZZZZ
MTQNEQLVTYLRGTGRELSAAQAQARFGIQNLSARMSELRQGDFRVRTRLNSTGKTSYAVSRRLMHQA